MKVKLVIRDENGRRIVENAQNTARRVEGWPAWKRNAPAEREGQQAEQTEQSEQTNPDQTGTDGDG